ncbi:MAG: RecT family recombinase, partial [Helcococcus sp.]|nr:RecT family recombinase [Helcococcus sp.]
MSNNQIKPKVSDVISQAIDTYGSMVENKQFDLPENYSFKNAIQQTRFLLTKPIESGKNQGKTLLDLCTPTSIMQSVMEMAQKGLNPAKEQCYFIPYGNRCALSISYQGKIAMAKRDGDDIKDVYGYAVYKDDEFELEFNIVNGTYNIKTYKPDVTKWSKDTLIGAFAIILDSQDKIKFTEYMTIDQIRAAWNMGAAKGQSPAHKNFPDQMAIKTVKSRAVKSFINSSDDSDLTSY